MLGGRRERVYFGVVIAVGKAHDNGSTSVVYGRELIDYEDGAGLCGNGNPFRLKNKQQKFIWSNEEVRIHRIKIGKVFKYLKPTASGDCVYHDKVDVRLNQNTDKILMDMDYGCGCYKGINDAFPCASIDQQGHLFQQDSPPQARIALISIKKAVIKDGRILFTTQKGEKLNLRLNCREHFSATTEIVNLPIKRSDEEIIEAAVVLTFSDGAVPSRGFPFFYAVCEGIISRKKGLVLPIDMEEVKLLNSDKEPVNIVKNGFSVLMDTGNTAQTAVSSRLAYFLNLKVDRRKMRCVEVAGGVKLNCPQVPLTLSVRNNQFTIFCLVGALASDTDLLIGRDIIDPLLEKGFTLGN